MKTKNTLLSTSSVNWKEILFSVFPCSMSVCVVCLCVGAVILKRKLLVNVRKLLLLPTTEYVLLGH